MLNTLFIASFVAITLGSVPCWYRAFKRLRNRESILQGTERIESPLGVTDVAIMFLTWFAGQFAGLSLADLLAPTIADALQLSAGTLDAIEANRLAVMAGVCGGCQLAFTALGLMIIWFRYRNWEIFGFRKLFVRRDFMIGCIAFLMVIPGVLLIQNLLTQFVDYEHATLEILQNNHSLFTLASTWFAAVIAAPICEEIFFRGILQSWLQRFGKSGEEIISGGWSNSTQGSNARSPSVTNLSASQSSNPYSPPSQQPIEASTINQSNSGWPPRTSFDPHNWAPVVISSVMFGMVHIGQGAAPIPLFVFGLALGYLYRQTASVLPCIVLHMGLNAFSMFWFTMQMLYPESVAP